MKSVRYAISKSMCYRPLRMLSISCQLYSGWVPDTRVGKPLDTIAREAVIGSTSRAMVGSTAMKICDVTPDNAEHEGFFCIKSSANPGVQCKSGWFAESFRDGLRVKILRDDEGGQLAFIEYVPAESAWRPVHAPGYMFIHCISGYRREHRGKGLASVLIAACEQDARDRNLAGTAVMTSDGPWMASMQVFLKNGYTVVDRRGRFELMTKKFERSSDDPILINWEEKLAGYRGWHLVYADQCPWHDKAANDLRDEARSHGIDMNVKRLRTPREAQAAPSGFGVFSLICDGELIEDHYISRTRFRNIIRKRM